MRAAGDRAEWACVTTARIVSVAILLVLCPAVTDASGTDVVQVTNGDRFTGDVVRLERGVLSFRTAAAGTIPIAWAQVVRITSTKILDVELASGARFSGSITSPADGRIVIQVSSGTTTPLLLHDVVRITPVASGFRARTSGSIDAGVTFRTAQRATDYAFDGAALYHGRSFETEATLSSWLSRRDDAAREARSDLLLDARRLLRSRWFALARLEGQQNDEIALDWRFLAGGGAGRRLAQSNETMLLTHAGLDYNAERYLGTATDQSAEVFLGADWDYFPAGGATEARVIATTYASLERARDRLEVDGQLGRELFWNLYWALHVLESYDSDPPGDERRSDFGVSGTLGWRF